MRTYFKISLTIMSLAILSACADKVSEGSRSDAKLSKDIVGTWTAYDVKDIVFGETRVVTELSKSEFRADHSDTGRAHVRFIGDAFPSDLGTFKLKIDSHWSIEDGILIQTLLDARVTAGSDSDAAKKIAKDMEARSLSAPELESEIVTLNEDELVLKVKPDDVIIKYRKSK